jgi:hypothetical protein
MKKFIKRLIFGKPKLMSVYKNKYGKFYGGFIHNNDGKFYVDNVSHIQDPIYLGKLEIY